MSSNGRLNNDKEEEEEDEVNPCTTIRIDQVLELLLLLLYTPNNTAVQNMSCLIIRVVFVAVVLVDKCRQESVDDDVGIDNNMERFICLDNVMSRMLYIPYTQQSFHAKLWNCLPKVLFLFFTVLVLCSELYILQSICIFILYMYKY